MKTITSLVLAVLLLTMAYASSNDSPIPSSSMRVISSNVLAQSEKPSAYNYMTKKAKAFDINDSMMAQSNSRSMRASHPRHAKAKFAAKHKLHKEMPCHSRFMMNKSFRMYNQQFPEYLVHYNSSTRSAELLNHTKAQKHIKQFEWFATYDHHHDAYYIHSTAHRHMVWTNSVGACGATSFKLAPQVNGNRNQLFRKSDKGWIFSVTDNVKPNCSNVHGALRGKGYQDGLSFNKVHGVTSLVNTRQAMFWKFETGELNTNASDPMEREIIVIHDAKKHRLIGLPWTPQEDRNVFVESFTLNNTRRNYWWVENVDRAIVIHSYYAPDMVLACVNAKKGATLQLQKRIPGDTRQMFKRDETMKSLTCLAKKGNKELSLRLNNSFPAVLRTNDSSWRMKIHFTKVDVAPAVPVWKRFRFCMKHQSYRNYCYYGTKNGHLYQTTNKNDKRAWWYSVPMNNGFVIHSVEYPGYVWTRSNSHLYLRQYFPGDPNQLFTRTQKKHGGLAMVWPDKSGHRTYHGQQYYSSMQHMLVYRYSSYLRVSNYSTSWTYQFRFNEDREMDGFSTDIYFNVQMAINKGLLVQTGNNVTMTRMRKNRPFAQKIMSDWWARKAIHGGHTGYVIFSRSQRNMAWTLVNDHHTGRRSLRLTHLMHNCINRANLLSKECSKNVHNILFNYDGAKHAFHSAIPHSGRGHSARYWVLSVLNFSLSQNSSVYFYLRTRATFGLKQKVHRRLTDVTLDSHARNVACPMCGAYELQDWRDRLWGVRQDYPHRYLSIQSPENQIMSKFPADHKVCNVRNSRSTAPCMEFFDVKNVHAKEYSTPSGGNITNHVKWYNFHSSMIKPERVWFFDNTVWMRKHRGGHIRKYERIRQAYKFSDSRRTPNVGLYWNKVNFSRIRIDEHSWKPIHRVHRPRPRPAPVATPTKRPLPAHKGPVAVAHKGTLKKKNP